MAILDFLDRFKNKVGGVIDKASSTISNVQDYGQKIGDFLTGESDEYRSLQQKYQPLLDQKRSEMIEKFRGGNTKSSDYEDWRANRLDKVFSKEIQENPEFGEYLKQKEEITYNKFLNAIPMGGLESKFSGKSGRALLKIAQSTIVEDIVPQLKKLNIADDIIDKLAPKMAKTTDMNVLYRMSKAGEVMSNIQKNLGEKIDQGLASKISESVNRIAKTTVDKNTEELALKKLTSDITESIIEKEARMADDIMAKLPDDLFNLLDEAKQSENIGEFKAKLNTETVEELNKNGINANDLYKTARTKFAKEAETAETALINKTSKEVLEAEKKIGEAVRKGEATVDDWSRINEKADKIREGKITKQELTEAKATIKDISTKSKESKLLKIAEKAPSFEDFKGHVLAKDSSEDFLLRTFNKANPDRPAKLLEKAEKATGKLPKSEVKKTVRSTTGQIKEGGTIPERSALKTKFQAMQKASKEGSRSALKTTKEFRSEVRAYASDLPKEVQRKIFSQVKVADVKTEKQLTEILNRVDKFRSAVKKEASRKKELKEVLPMLKTLREKGKLGQIQKTIDSLGLVNKKGEPLKNIREGIKRLSKEKLTELKKAAKEAMDTTPQKIDYDQINFKKIGGVATSESKGKNILKQLSTSLEKGLGITSTNIRKYGGDELYYAIRKRRYRINTFGKMAEEKISPFMKGIKKLKGKAFGRGKEAYNKLSYALFNQDFKTARAIAKENGFEEGFEQVTKLLDDIHKQANEVGLKIGNLQNFFPRVVNDYDGLYKAYTKKFGKEGRSYFDKILTDIANNKMKKLADLTVEERAEGLTNALRGYGAGRINVGSVTKGRRFQTIDPEFLKFYSTPEDSLISYVSKMNERIELKRLFGLDGNEQDSIGAMVDKLVTLGPDEAYRLKESLGAVLAPQGKETWALNKLRKTATVTLLAHINSALTQFGDISLNAVEHGPLKALASLVRKKPFKRDEIFTEISHEFSDSNFIKNSLKAVGFDRIDRLNNEAFMANAFRKATKIARKGKGKAYDELLEYISPMLRNNDEQVVKLLDDFKNKNITDDVRFYVFNKALDINPRAMEEMPEAYLKHPNARVFYSMKSYGLKVLDIYRREVLQEASKGNKAKALKKFTVLTGILTMAGASVDQVRDWYNGKEGSFSGKIVNNMLKIGLMSTWDTTSIKQDGLGRTIASKILPPTRLIDDISRDVTSAGDGKGLSSLRNVPVIGAEIYNRVGRGKETIAKSNLREKVKTGKFTNKELAQLKREKPATFARVMKIKKWERLGLSSKEQEFSSLGVEDGKRAERIVKYLRKTDDWKKRYALLKKAGIITDDVDKQIKLIMR